MPTAANGPVQASILVDLAAIFVSLELSRATWLITSLSPGRGERMSKHSVRSGDVAGLLGLLARLRDKALARTGKTVPVIVIQEAGLDGYWVHRVLEEEGVESHVVDAASILTSRRRRRAVRPGHRRPRAPALRPAPAAGRADDGRRPSLAPSPEEADRP